MILDFSMGRCTFSGPYYVGHQIRPSRLLRTKVSFFNEAPSAWWGRFVFGRDATKFHPASGRWDKPSSRPNSARFTVNSQTKWARPPLIRA